MQRVLVVGDWLVDEHWVVGQHRSESASRTGERHSRALHTANCSVRSLCGAGQVATILYNARDTEHMFEVNGLGLWHSRDEQELQEMLNPRNNIGNTPHRLIPPQRYNYSNSESRPIGLYNLAKDPQLGEQVGTTRVIRVYEQER